MKKITFILLSLCLSSVTAQSFDFTYDHLSIVVEDSNKSAIFYSTILQLEEIPHPDKTPGFRWFRIDNNKQLHLIEKEFIPFVKNKSMHLCLATQNLDAVVSHLKKNAIAFSDWSGKQNAITLRTDGVHQIYLQDPDGYWIEINDAKH